MNSSKHNALAIEADRMAAGGSLVTAVTAVAGKVAIGNDLNLSKPGSSDDHIKHLSVGQ